MYFGLNRDGFSVSIKVGLILSGFEFLLFLGTDEVCRTVEKIALCYEFII